MSVFFNVWGGESESISNQRRLFIFAYECIYVYVHVWIISKYYVYTTLSFSQTRLVCVAGMSMISCITGMRLCPCGNNALSRQRVGSRERKSLKWGGRGTHTPVGISFGTQSWNSDIHSLVVSTPLEGPGDRIQTHSPCCIGVSVLLVCDTHIHANNHKYKHTYSTDLHAYIHILPYDSKEGRASWAVADNTLTHSELRQQRQQPQ